MSEITLRFPDGAERRYPKGITGKELAEGISKSLAKKAVAIARDGELADLADPIDADAEIKIDNTREFAAKIGQELGSEGYKGRAAVNA